MLGTVGYMSPEQVRGDGRRPPLRHLLVRRGALRDADRAGAPSARHRGRDDDRDPQRGPARALGRRPRARSRPALERIVRHCLEKSPDERFQSARDLAFDLEALSRLATSRRTTALAAGAGAAPRGRAARRAARCALALVGAGLRLGRLGARARAERAGAAPASFTQLTDPGRASSAPELSPDGKIVRLRRRRRRATATSTCSASAARNPINLTADSPARRHQPAFSPDGERIAFRSERDGGGIFVMGATGESVRRLTDFGYDPAWSPDGREIVSAPSGFDSSWPDSAERLGELWAVDVATGQKRQDRAPDGDAVQPSWSPHGQRIAYWGLRGTAASATSGRSPRRRRPASAVAGDERRGARLEPGLVAGRPLPLLRERPRRHDEPVAGGDRRGDGPHARRARAAAGAVLDRLLTSASRATAAGC